VFLSCGVVKLSFHNSSYEGIEQRSISIDFYIKEF